MLCVVDRPRRQHDSVNVRLGKELVIGAATDAELCSRFGHMPRTGGGDRDEPGTVEPERIAGVYPAHPAEPGNPDSQHAILVTLDTAKRTMSASQSLAQS